MKKVCCKICGQYMFDNDSEINQSEFDDVTCTPCEYVIQEKRPLTKEEYDEYVNDACATGPNLFGE